MRVQYQPTQADYVSASRSNYLAQLRTWRGCRPLVVVALVVVVAINGFDYASTGELDPFWLGWVAFVIILLPLAVGLNLLLVPRKVRRMFAEQPGFTEPMTVEWSADGFIITNPMTTHRLSWTGLFAWRDTRNDYLLYVTRTGCLFVPKRVFDAEQALDFEQGLAKSRSGTR